MYNDPSRPKNGSAACASASPFEEVLHKLVELYFVPAATSAISSCPTDMLEALFEHKTGSPSSSHSMVGAQRPSAATHLPEMRPMHARPASAVLGAVE